MKTLPPQKAYRSKRVFDLILGSILLLFATPLLTFFGLYLYLKEKKSPLRWLDASGQSGIPFRRPVLDFKTKCSSEFLRKLTGTNRSLQNLLINLPSLFLVLKGKMSLIGPSSHHFRKHLFLSDHLEDYEQRLKARPGLISPAVLAPKPCSEKLSSRIEILYCQKASLSFDLWLLGRYLRGLSRG
jgi:lipopolysaccharide/colanic/teichoic acid biosynthesis glycosyltransferase